MAAPMKTHARICLTFEDEVIEKTWILIKYAETPLISDIIKKIADYFLDIRSPKKNLVLRLQSAVLPNWESSEILQDNDTVTVRVEKVQSSKRKHGEIRDETKTADRKTRKRKGMESEESAEERPKVKKKKSKIASPVKFHCEDKIIDDPSFSKSTVNTEVDKTEAIQLVNREVKDVAALVQSQTEGANMDETVSDPGTSTKKKRKRIRKHRKKKLVQMDDINTSENSNVYKGREVGEDELFFGSIPDKLLNPKHYRHGYNNLKVYQPEPNKHTKFESDEEVVETENTEQYNFLSNTKLLEEREAYKDVCSSNELVCRNQSFTDNIEESPVAEIHSKYNWDQNDIELNRSNHMENDSKVEVSQSPTNNGMHTPNGYHSDTVHTNNYTAQPFNYPNSEPRQIRTDVRPVPSQLERKVLASGASVFVRQRPGRRNQLNNGFEMSKTDQLNTVATNISTIFVNPDSCVQESPGGKQISMIQNGGDQTCQTTPSIPSQGAVDYSKLPPLKGEPKKGDRIIYKILEISETCTPEISEYREALVLNVDKNQMVELKNIGGAREMKKNRFHMELEDDDEVLTNMAESEEVVQLHLSSLLEPRIMAA